jgi:CheY-like chemotaxis protein
MRGERVLVIDGEKVLRRMADVALEGAGCWVETAADGPEGLARFGTGEDWDLVLLDQWLPGTESLEVLRRMRDRNPDVRIIVISRDGLVSRDASIGLAAEALKAGAIGFWRKPLTPGALQAAVENTLRDTHQEPLPDNVPVNSLLWRAGLS